MANDYGQKRPVDELADKSYSVLRKGTIYIAKTRVNFWKGLVILAFFGGIVMTLIILNAMKQ